ncbi:MAG: beta-N-acetylglucosaminidase domain-containing protein, partial [Sphingomonadales bacterium]
MDGVTVPRLGIVEGYFGRAWSWQERLRVMQFAAAHDYSFFLHAPKEDSKLRRDWREPFHETELRALADFAADCRKSGVSFGVGLSPFEVYLDFNEAER